ncbi:hypothetical protein DYI25_20520 [Mesobacillus boroniphilus]|uniref:Uncharacterized protein n=1 Tax=Mesobacillus boroniphilus TaxID=308892 RepID=A0A944GYB6_9BACI|nr:hypothetical protein [Mesobacillus boroniphilus]MBS8266812.1 hypothetical protein [Mesobacillus boroniphilus]
MHFRQLIITGFIAGAAMLVPDMAFAEKGSNAGKSEHTMAAEQITLPDKAESAKTSDPAVKKQTAQRKPVNQKPVQTKADANPAVAGKSKGKAPSLIKNEKAAKPQKSKAVVKKKTNQAKNRTKHINNRSIKGATKSVHNKSDYAKETKRKSPGLKDKVEPSRDSAVKPADVKSSVKVASRKTPPVEKDEHDSSQHERYPKGDNLPNPPSRSKASGGPSSDRTSYGNTSTFLSDKWFVWDQSFNFNLIQPYSSRVAVFRSQWVNAPPSPPPLKAPAFLTYTDATSHGSRL